VSITRRLRRPAQLFAIACALLVPATAGTAFAAADPRAQERYYSSYRAADSSPAHAQERYYSSYGEREPLSLPQSPAPSNETPWTPIALSIAAALAIVAVSATQLRRGRTRRARAARTPA
jgi:hypothetical protein